MESTPLINNTEANHLRDRRQFLLSTDASHVLLGGKRVFIGGRYHLSAHPDLELTHVEHDGKSLTLLGFVLDPDSPESGNEHVLLRRIDVAGSPEEVIPRLKPTDGTNL